MSVRCGMTSCTHNDNDGNCYASVLNIRGERARITDETLCCSFIDEDLRALMEFSEEFNSSNKRATTTNIKCGASRCIYNVARLCKADKIKVNPETASCDTFITP